MFQIILITSPVSRINPGTMYSPTAINRHSMYHIYSQLQINNLKKACIG